MSLILKSIDEEASVGDLALHCHHEVVCETLSEPAGNRICLIF